MVDASQAELDGLIHGEMAPGFLGLLLGRLVDRLVEDGGGPAEAAGIRAPVRTFSMMLLLDRADQSVTELARRLGVTHAAVIKTSRALGELGFLARGDDTADARRKPLRLTPAGRAEAARIADYMARAGQVYAGLFEEIGGDLFAVAQAFDVALDRDGFASRMKALSPHVAE
ncbi:MarR family transcriptional regulator [Maricaulis maris]|uniref:MarR family transcriptional regulator n=1 Tax=Maricaulis maris TaxID=74318 RepID=UPI003B8CBD5C